MKTCNLLQETIGRLADWGKAPQDVVWIGTSNNYCLWEDYMEIANKEYDDGFGSQEVSSDLLIVGRDWWMERHEYDGSEWWEFKKLPKRPKNNNKNITIFY